ncbi:MAG TPA: hypothetical protein VFQ07_10375, partial [Candidatus Polarisedimenticolia bacterium]|nr:hypothetical protein [Candidatus Polarisedimenticolia bacterium]
PRSPHRIPLSLRLSQGTGRRGVERRLARLAREFSWETARDFVQADVGRLTAGRRLDLRGWPAIPARWDDSAGGRSPAAPGPSGPLR